MDNIFRDIQKSLSNKNFYAAIFMVFTIPDILLSITMGKHLGDDYAEWFEKNMQKYKKFMTGLDCYALRCAILHEGTDNVLNQSKKDVIEKFEFLYPEQSSHLVYMGGNKYNGVIQPVKLLLNLNRFCKDMIFSAENYIKDNNLKIIDLIDIKERYNDGFISIG